MVRIFLNWLCFGSTLFMLYSCGGKNTEPYVKEPGVKESSKKDVLETGTELLQNKAPIKGRCMAKRRGEAIAFFNKT